MLMTIIKILFLLNMAFVAWTLVSPANAQQPATALERCGNTSGALVKQISEMGEQLDLARIENAALKKQIEDAKAAKPEEKK
jgi:hypothetical protein